MSQLARRSGLPVKTLRCYPDLVLLPAAGRSAGGYRLFAEESLRRLGFIRRLKTLGLSLEDIQACLAVHDAGKLPCGDIREQLQRQIGLVDERLRELRQFRAELQCLLDNWQSDPAPNAAVICPNLNASGGRGDLQQRRRPTLHNARALPGWRRSNRHRGSDGQQHPPQHSTRGSTP